MICRMKTDEDVMDLKFRQRVITEIEQGENVMRRTEHLKRREVYKGNNRTWIRSSLYAEGLKPETVEGILARTPRHRVCGKIVNKKARAYNAGVKRNVQGSETATKQVETLASLVDFDGRMRTSDRYRELHKNTLLGILPQIANGDAEEPVYRVVLRPLAPFEYDVIEDEYDREKARCVILSDFVEFHETAEGATDDEAATHMPKRLGTDGRDGILADAPNEQGVGIKRVFIWWTATYTFTTDDKGEILEGPPEYKNPIEKLPFLNNAEGQDGKFWAEGGEDLAEADILINKMIGDMNYVAYLQGFGQYVVTGQNVNDRVTVGPNHVIAINYTAEEPEPKVFTVNPNPPLDSWLRMIEQQVAMALTTNDLSAGHVASTLTANTFPSGVAMLIELSEATTGVEDKQRQYVRMESQAWPILFAWQNYFVGIGQVDEAFGEVGRVADGVVVTTRFNEVKPVVTETERLASIKARKDLGLITRADALMQDNPGITREEAEAKLKEIDDEAQARKPDMGDEDGGGEDDEDAESKEPGGGKGDATEKGEDADNE